MAKQRSNFIYINQIIHSALINHNAINQSKPGDPSAPKVNKCESRLPIRERDRANDQEGILLEEKYR